MRLVRYLTDQGAQYGVIEGAEVYALRGDPYGSSEIGERVGALKEVRLLPPCVPSKIITVGLNYEFPSQDGVPTLPDEPVLSLKPPSALVASGGPICWPRQSTRLDFEGELAIVIGKCARNVEPFDAAPFILGVTCANDVTARDLQRREGQWARAKGFDTFCPLGPCIATDVDPSNCHLITRVNRDVRQEVWTSRLHFAPHVLVSYISKIMTLLPGDVILTGTPPGSGPLRIGDVVEVEIEGVGILWNTVVAADCRGPGEAGSR